MLRFINSDLIENNYLRIILLVIIICFLTYLQYYKYSKKIEGGWPQGVVRGPKYKNYIGYFIIYFVIPKFFDVNNGILNLINIVGFVTTFFTSLYAGNQIFGINLILIIISLFI
jgi:hypothetical protein